MPHISQMGSDGIVTLYVWFEAMHTRVDILIKSNSHTERQLLGVADRVRQIIFDLEMVGNRFAPTSEISRLNGLSSNESVIISDTMYNILSQCKYYYDMTDGLFDITVSTPGYVSGLMDDVYIGHNHDFMKKRDGIILDLSGFLKGYALDCIRPYLEKQEVVGALINLGNSSIMAIGDIPGPVTNGCLTTSGNSDESRCHIINPVTGRFIQGADTEQVVTSGGAEGEVLATVNFIRKHM